MGNLNGSIYFQFTQDATDIIMSEANFGKNNDNVPVGNYEAVVTVELVGV